MDHTDRGYRTTFAVSFMRRSSRARRSSRISGSTNRSRDRSICDPARHQRPVRAQPAPTLGAGDRVTSAARTAARPADDRACRVALRDRAPAARAQAIELAPILDRDTRRQRLRSHGGLAGESLGLRPARTGSCPGGMIRPEASSAVGAADGDYFTGARSRSQAPAPGTPGAGRSCRRGRRSPRSMP